MKFKSYLAIVLFVATCCSSCMTRKKVTASQIIETAIDEALNAPNKKDEHPAKKGWPPKF